MKLEEELLEQYFDVIEKNGNTENQIQEFLEENTIFIILYISSSRVIRSVNTNNTPLPPRPETTVSISQCP